MVFDTLQKGANMSDTDDRRSQRSRRLLWGALIGLLQQRDWAEINVQMICERADVARSTFYAHYQTKQDLLDAGFALGLGEAEAAILNTGEDFAVITWLVEHLSGSADFHARLRGSAAGLAIMERFRRRVRDLIAADLARRGRTLPRPELQFLTGGIFAVAEAWLDRGCDESAPVLADRLRTMAKRFVT